MQESSKDLQAVSGPQASNRSSAFEAPPPLYAASNAHAPIVPPVATANAAHRHTPAPAAADCNHTAAYMQLPAIAHAVDDSDGGYVWHQETSAGAQPQAQAGTQPPAAAQHAAPPAHADAPAHNAADAAVANKVRVAPPMPVRQRSAAEYGASEGLQTTGSPTRPTATMGASAASGAARESGIAVAQDSGPGLAQMWQAALGAQKSRNENALALQSASATHGPSALDAPATLQARSEQAGSNETNYKLSPRRSTPPPLPRTNTAGANASLQRSSLGSRGNAAHANATISNRSNSYSSTGGAGAEPGAHTALATDRPLESIPAVGAALGTHISGRRRRHSAAASDAAASATEQDAADQPSMLNAVADVSATTTSLSAADAHQVQMTKQSTDKKDAGASPQGSPRLALLPPVAHTGSVTQALYQERVSVASDSQRRVSLVVQPDAAHSNSSVDSTDQVQGAIDEVPRARRSNVDDAKTHTISATTQFDETVGASESLLDASHGDVADALAVVADARALFLGRYALARGGSAQRYGGQGVVHFAATVAAGSGAAVAAAASTGTSVATSGATARTSSTGGATSASKASAASAQATGQEVALKFYVVRAAFDRILSLDMASLGSAADALLAVVPNNEGVATGGVVLPPCVVTQKGETLDAWAARVKPHLPACLQALCGIAAEIVTLHSAGYVYYALKPGNVARVGRRWMLVDFGCVARSGAQL